MKRTKSIFPILLNALLCLILVYTVGCGLQTQTNKEPEADMPDSIQESLSDTEGEQTISDNSDIDAIAWFANPKHLYFFDDWIYYNEGDELRKCRLDLSNETIVFSEGFGTRFTINNAGQSLQKTKSDEWYIFDVINGSKERVNLPASSANQALLWGQLYKDNIFIEGNQIDMYDRKGNFLKSVVPEMPLYYSIVDDLIYYLPFFSDDTRTTPGNVIMCYDIVNGNTEKLFEFELTEYQVILEGGNSKYFLPEVYFFNRNIIIQNGVMSFVYTGIDSIEIKEVVFDVTENIDILYSTDEDIFFCSSLTMEEGNIHDEYYRVAYGTVQPILLKEFVFNGYPVCFAEGYLYYYEYEEDEYSKKLKREEFY